MKLTQTFPTHHLKTAALSPEPGTLTVAEEVPLALYFSGVEYAVMMVTPADLEDFITGFTLTEAFITSVTDVREITITEREGGLHADILLAPEALRRVLTRTRRAIAGRTSCGICGSDSETVMNAASGTVTGHQPSPAAIRYALTTLRSRQVLNRDVGMLHAAAWCDPAGNILIIREDVGRHNALDKLIGAGLRSAAAFTDGFCLLTSRCSYEMAAKAITAGMSAVAALSAPTALAVRTAQKAGLCLIAPARENTMQILTGCRTADGETPERD